MSSAEYDRVRITANNGQSYILADRLRQLLDKAGMVSGYSLLDRLRQGSYNPGVEASGGTHDEGGAADLSISGLNGATVDRLVLTLRSYGCAAWHRTPDQGDWGPHVHLIDSGANDLSDAAHDQVVAYEQGKDGLASGGPDDGPNVRPLTPYKYQEATMSWQEKLPATPFSAGVKKSLGDPTPDEAQQAGATQVNTAARLQRVEETVNRIAKAVGVKPAGADDA